MFTIKKKNLLLRAGLFLLVGCAFTYELIRKAWGDTAYICLVGLGCAFLGLTYLSRGLRMRTMYNMLPWILLGLLSLWRNGELNHGVYNTEILFLLYLISAIFLSDLSDWGNSLLKDVKLFGFVHVIATIAFFVFRNMFSVMIDFWGYYPSGTESGTLGYRAGITTHYSQNATYIAMLFAVLASEYFCAHGKKKVSQTVQLGLTLFALLLTGKRAHLVFSVVSVIFVYFWLNKDLLSSKISKVLIGAVCGILLFSIAYEVFPETFNSLLGRFLDNGYDEITSGRIPMWILAVELFVKNPILGIGWFGYKYAYQASIYSGYAKALLNTHNVYLQILAEVGIVGGIIYLIALLRIKRQLSSNNAYGNLSPEIACMVVFYCLYSITGCCLYDLTFHIFILFVAFNTSLLNENKCNSLEDNYAGGSI